jgi:hypothetical protein
MSTNVNRFLQLGIRAYRRTPRDSRKVRDVDSDDLRRRLKAARALTAPSAEEIDQRSPRTRNAETGITVEELAKRMAEPGLGWKTIGAIERGDRTAQRRDLIVIAEALELPLAFFTLTHEQLVEALGGAGAPAIPGETGRRLREHLPSREDPAQPESDRGEDSSNEARG